MYFSITHPMHSHPYHPELACGEGISAVAAAAEAAGFHGFGFTDHPPRRSAGSTPVATTRWTRSWRWVSPPPAPPRCG
ncbi:luciferase-like domain protein [Mycobacterium xenopi 4042]|uniref:Luciferase-like domain protein n=1 Tax=Mycobacterium xenopi 4042 TaxID=1299334 RepID=X8BIR6_MYCXE|nr:luciferase-like domain protein [Mycobacterium xenopi 4042]